eukprot:TRINITY_DN6259_c0_g1_i1.p1 TRINITY_DN6259_c0_g1~~TRINITY_DN6259_c0_g1_i1.p1  ORF type:complete len:583 (-),score=60.98 TRINITY_DN6259_c0_g1_i1:344-1972(-)
MFTTHFAQNRHQQFKQGVAADKKFNTDLRKVFPPTPLQPSIYSTKTRLRPLTYSSSVPNPSSSSSSSSSSFPETQSTEVEALNKDGTVSQNGVGAESASAAEVKESGVEQPAGFYTDRWITFLSLWVGYACYYLTRNSLSYVSPVMLADASLGMDITQVGGLATIMPFAYGMSKFFSGALGSKTSPKLLLGGGLIATSMMNILFGFGTAYWWFCIFWAANGILQGIGSPACARLLTSWYNTKERGTFWSIWTASNNVGGFLAPIIAGTAAKSFGWRWGMYTPGIIGVIIGSIIIFTIRDSPEKKGYPPVEAPKKNKKKEEKKGGPSIMEILKQEVINNPYIWLFAISYFFIYVIRQGVTSWFVFYLKEVKGVVDTAQAAVQVSGIELGGLLGSLSSGALSDYVIRSNKTNAGTVGLRTRVVVVYTIGVALALLGFSVCPNIPWVQWLSVASVGFFIYGPQMLIGLCGAECVSPFAVGAANGFLGWISYLGAASAGYPLSLMVKQYGWGIFFTALVASCGIAILLLVPMLNLRSYTQQQEATA